jgi:DNA helicase-2/ATP-dependent DNA helicase PcrA
MQAIESLIQVVLVERDEASLATVIQGAYWGLKTSDLVRIMSARSFEHPLVEILDSDTFLASIGVSDVAAAKRVLGVVTEARARQSYESPQRVLEYLLDASGFLQFVMTRDPFDGARVVRRVYDEIESLVLHDGVTSLSDIRRLITLRRSYHLPLTAPYITTSTDAVSVMTAHKAKGLEFAVVFVPHLIDKEWGGKVSRQMFAVSLHKYAAASDLDPDDDERRLLYVAFTRAKEKLYLSAAVRATQGKDLAVSRLMTPIVESGLISVRETSEIEATFSPVSALRGFNQPVSPVDTAVLRQLLLTRGLSATSLNNLLRNPWDFLFRNLLRLPEVKSTHLQFGTAIHAVLERTTRHHTKTGVWPAAAELLLWLGVELRRLPLTAVEYTRLHEKGSQHLVAYLTHLERTVTTATREEVSVRTAITVPTPEPIDLPLSGKLDRCDLDDSSYVLRVVDYKTGKPKTRSVIAGDTKASNGDYLRQLEFYVLLLSVQDDERLKTNQTVLSFVEPSAKGEIKEEIFVITDEAVVKLKETLTQAVVQFLAGDFLRDETTLAETAYPALARAWLERGV